MTRNDATIALVGDGMAVPCLDGTERSYVNLDSAASTGALPAVADAVNEFLPWYSSVHRGAGYKSREATARYEQAREAAMRFAGRDGDGDDVAIICRNTTEAVNHLAYRMRFQPDDVVVSTVVEHHANLLPWHRAANVRHVECGVDGTFTTADVVAVLDAGPRPRLLAITAASNVTGWIPDLGPIIAAAHDRGIQVMVDAAQLAAHRPMPDEADFLAWSGHKMYAPFGAGILLGPRQAFLEGDPFMVGGGAVDLVELDAVAWTDPPDREEAGSPNVMGAIALHAAIDELGRVGWPALIEHDRHIATRLRTELAAIDGVRLLGPGTGVETTPVAAFLLEGPHAIHHGLVAARLSAEYGIGVRHGCFCAHPYLLRLLGISGDDVASYRSSVLRRDRREIPGAVRASGGINTNDADIDALLIAVAELAAGKPAPVTYVQDAASGDWWPDSEVTGWRLADRGHSAPCARG